MKQELSTIFASPFLDLGGLKRAILYFDQVKIPSRVSFGGCTLDEATSSVTRAEALIYITPETVLKEMALLVSEHIVDVVDLNADLHSGNKLIPLAGPEKNFREEIRRHLAGTVGSEAEAEIKHLSANLADSLWLTDTAKENYLDFVSDFYCEMYAAVNWMVDKHRMPLCTDSPVFLNIVHRAYDDDKFLDKILGQELSPESRESILAQKILEVYLPDLNNAPVEVILEARHRLGDELKQFRIQVGALASSMQNEGLSPDSAKEAEKIIRATVNPAVEDLKSKIKSSRDKVILRAFKNLQSPKSYVPFLGSALSDLSVLAAGFASIGLAALGTSIETVIEHREIMRANRFAFLIKASRFFRTPPARVSRERAIRLLGRVEDHALVAIRETHDFSIIYIEGDKKLLSLLSRDPEKARKFLLSKFGSDRQNLRRGP
jgi:hypothetical protein